MQQLKTGTTLQGGKYKILKVLGQGGFGITYLAENTMLDGKVAIKEFFFKDFCNRDEKTSHVTVPTDGNREVVQRFMAKFIKEARTIFKLNHPNIIRILDIFEENDTAYYVMDYIEGESLGDMVKRRGAIPESEAIDYIKEVGSALTYIHGKSINHLDIKPGNLMKRSDNGKIQVIDFGVAKQYDVVTSEGTTTTPVCICCGYSPLEQYQTNGVQTFSPQSDVYALAATLFKLLTGITPPEAIVVQDKGLPVEELRMKGVSETVVSAIAAAMQTRTNRTQSVAEFLKNLDNTDDEVTVLTAETQKTEEEERLAASKAERNKYIMWAVIAVIGIAVAVVGANSMLKSCKSNISDEQVEDTIASISDEQVEDTIASSEVKSIWINDNQVDIYTANGVPFEMVAVEGGTFTMGATSEQGADAWDIEKPAHNVTLSDYYIGKTEVTQALWKAVMGKTLSQIVSEYKSLDTYGVGDNYPMYYISWNDCQEFIKKLNSWTGKNFRLPTEAEWEYAARGGSKIRGYKYSGSDNIDDVAWYCDNSGGKTHEVGTKRPNELGIYDMSGNVWEWCSDWYGSYSSAAQTDPKGPDSGSGRVCRGGCWSSNAGYCRSSKRSYDDPGSHDYYTGFRLCLSK